MSQISSIADKCGGKVNFVLITQVSWAGLRASGLIPGPTPTALTRGAQLKPKQLPCETLGASKPLSPMSPPDQPLGV